MKVGNSDQSGNNDELGTTPDVVLACAGDVPTLETLAAAAILRERLPRLRIRVINIVDLIRVAISFSSTVGTSNYDPRADVNGDSVINIIDLSRVAFYFTTPAFS